MTQTLTIRDETLGKGLTHEFSLDILTEELTVRELIRSRVYQEVQDYNLRQQQQPEATFRGLVQPTDAEQTLNGCRTRQGRAIDWKQQFEKAVDAFMHNQFIILVNDLQMESLDQRIEVRPDTRVSFLRLTMLVGG